jgi:hypothetical protein
MNAYTGSRGIAPFVLNLGTSQRSVVNFISWVPYYQERTLVPIEEEVGWSPELVWTVFGEEKISCLCRYLNSRLPSP